MHQIAILKPFKSESEIKLSFDKQTKIKNDANLYIFVELVYLKNKLIDSGCFALISRSEAVKVRACANYWQFKK